MSDLDVREKIGALSAKAEAAHNRIDKLETAIRDDLREIKDQLKELNGFMHRGKGWSHAMLFIYGLCGAGIFKVLLVIFKQ